MNLLKEINEINSFQKNDVVIEDYNIDYNSITLKNYKNNISTYECSNYEIDGWFKINDNEEDAITFKTSLTVEFDVSYEDNRMQFTHGSESGVHDFGSGNVVEIVDITANSIEYTDALGHYSSQPPKELLDSFGNDESIRNSIAKKCKKLIIEKSSELIEDLPD